MVTLDESEDQADLVRSLRHGMVESQLVKRGIADPRVLDALRCVPREAFVPDDLAAHAYDDGPLPIGEGQTISQPYVVAVMTELLALRPHDRVLEIGTGCGYAAAVLAELASEVVTVERVESLCVAARGRLQRLGYPQVQVHCGDGTKGWPPGAPYDAISVTAAASEVPPALLEQLAVGGRLVMPVGPPHAQMLTRVVREANGALRTEPQEAVRFVPLL